eukprot:1190330-Prorocentrum_minimum.AAC.2
MSTWYRAETLPVNIPKSSSASHALPSARCPLKRPTLARASPYATSVAFKARAEEAFPSFSRAKVALSASAPPELMR